MNSKFLDNIKVDMVSEDQMSDKDRNALFNREASVDAIPDINLLTKNVFEIVSYLEKQEVKDQMKINDFDVKMYLNNTYADSVPLGIITVLLDESTRVENVERLLNLFEQLVKAKAGEISLQDAEADFAEKVNEKYLYSKYGSKEKFLSELAKETKN